MRLSLGATRWRLIRQSLTESVLIAVSGAACGMLFTICLLRIAGAVLPRMLPNEVQAGMDWRAPLFALATCLATALLFGLAPALRLSRCKSSPGERFSLSAALKTTHGWRGGLVVTEIALTFVLVAVGGLLTGTLLRLLAVNTGMRPQNLLTFSTVLPERRYPDAPSILRYQQQLLERLRLLPAVRGASIAETLPLGGSQSMTIFRKDGPASRAFSTTFNLVTPGYFATVGARLQKGRWFSEADSTGQNPVVVVSETFARRFFAAEDPLGRSIYPVRSISPHTIIGVVADVKLMDLRTPGSDQMYLLYGQAPEGFVASVSGRRLYFLVRTASAPLTLAPAIQRLAAEVDAEQPVFQFRSMEDVILESVPRERLRAVLLAAFAATALLLATAGVYGILHYSVVQRTQEIGIRMALGAQVRDVVGMILRQGMTLVLPGVAIGLAAALMLTRLLQSMLFEIKPRDPATFVVVTLVMIAASCFACYLPARRAAKTDPLKSLRYE
jgi:putative ABC transport system permease protein